MSAMPRVFRLVQHFSTKNYSNVNGVKKRAMCSTASAIQHEQSTSEPNENIEPKWESVIGLEIHAQINANSKLFSGSSTVFGAPTNSQVSYIDASLPGTLPVLNKYCVEAGVRTALALNSTIHKSSSFDRKHYFYSDLPAGYQITQQFHPLATNGYLEFYVYNLDRHIKPYKCRSRLKQLQLEQDSGRSFHVEGKRTLVDLNRAGIGLMELVFEPDLKNGYEAAMLVKELQLILRTIGTCTGIMEEGALRVDANISVHKSNEPWGVRTEVKNLNSFKYIEKAINFEINRQIQTLEAGDIIYNETRSFDYKSKQTVFMRDKETFQDYRFMPEPNLPIVQLCDDQDTHLHQDSNWTLNIDAIQRQMPILPAQERKHLIEMYNISYENADRLVKGDGMKEYFENVISSHSDQSYAVLFLTSSLQHQLKLRKLSFKECPLPPSKAKELIQLVDDMIISEATAIDILEMFFNGDQRSASEIVEAYNWYVIKDEKELEKHWRELFLNHPKLVKKFRNAPKKKNLLTSLLIKFNQTLNDRAHIKTAESVLKRLISENKKKSPKSNDNQ